jgi:hypothetical protein
MHIFGHQRGIFLPKHAGGSGMGDSVRKTSFFGVLGFLCTEEPPPSIQTGMLSFWRAKGNHAALFYTLLSQYVSVGELTEGWKTLGEYTPTLRSFETQFCEPFLAFELLMKPTKLVTEGYDFSLRSFWQVVELKRSSYDQIKAVLRI